MNENEATHHGQRKPALRQPGRPHTARVAAGWAAVVFALTWTLGASTRSIGPALAALGLHLLLTAVGWMAVPASTRTRRAATIVAAALSVAVVIGWAHTLWVMAIPVIPLGIAALTRPRIAPMIAIGVVVATTAIGLATTA